MTPAEQTEQLARDVLHAHRGNLPADIAEARRLVRLAAALNETQELAVAQRLLSLCKEAERDAEAHHAAMLRNAWR